MKYSLYINQFAVVQHGLLDYLDVIDLLFFDFIRDAMNDPNTIKVRIGEFEYTEIRHNFFNDQMPLLKVSSRTTFLSRMNNLCNIHLIEKYENNQIEGRSLYRRGDNFNILTFTDNLNGKGVQQNEKGSSGNCIGLFNDLDSPLQQNEHYNNTIYNNTNNNNTNNKPTKKKDKQKDEPIDHKTDPLITFERLWSIYDKREAKPRAVKAWNKLKDDEKVMCIRKAGMYVSSTPDKVYRQHLCNWITNKGFMEEEYTKQNVRPGRQQQSGLNSNTVRGVLATHEALGGEYIDTNDLDF